MSFVDLNHAEDTDFTPDDDNRICSVLCDEEHDGLRCDNYADVLIKDDIVDGDAAYWNRELATALRGIGWKITDAHDYCPIHANADVKKGDANAVPISVPVVA